MYRSSLISKLLRNIFSLIPLLFLVVLLITNIVIEALSQIDKSADKQYREFIQASIAQQAKVVGTLAMDYAWWDEAIIKLVESPDRDWADNNIGSYMNEKFGISMSFVLGRDDQIISAFKDGIYSLNLDYLLQNATLIKMHKIARSMSISSPTPVHSLARVGTELFIVGAFPFTPEVERNGPRAGSHLSVLTFLKRVDDEFLKNHAKAFHLNIQDVTLGKSKAGVPLYDLDNVHIGNLQYSPPIPSKEFLTKVIVPILLLVVVLSVIIFMVVRGRKQISDLNREIKTDKNKLKINSEILKGIHEAVVITDSEGRITEVNDSHCQLMGYEREEVIGKDTSLFKSGIHDAEFYRQMWHELNTNGHWEGEVYDKRKNGEIFPKWLSISAVEDEAKNDKKFIGIFTDISKLKEQEKRLKQIAHFDSLTQLPNRLLFQERVEQKLLMANRRDGGLVAIFFIDIDHFKHVNDSLGHSVGDQLLITIAKRITESLRASDTVSRICSDDERAPVIARIGGDEFTVALDGIHDIQEITPIITRLQSSLNEPLFLDRKEVFPSASIGISVYPHDGDNYSTLMKHADTAMYCSKKEGRNLFHFFSNEMNMYASKRIELESSLRKALKNGDFTLHYQPKMDMARDHVYGVEALIRWHDQELGFIPPSDFIPVAEETSLILDIGDWVLNTACCQVAEWNKADNVNIQLAVNLSGRQFKDSELLSKIVTALNKSGLQPSALELEVTETVMIDDIDHAISSLQSLRDIGVSIAIDDFGTGYSSLSYLKQLPVDTLKLDRSFSAQMQDDERVAAITESIIHMGQKLALMIVAEGIETEHQSAQLLEYGCNYQQGFLHARPLPAEAALNFIYSHQERINDLN